MPVQRPARPRRGRDDRGAATPLVVAVVAFAALGLVAVGHLGAAAADAARARTAADAVALGVLVGGDAERLATDNGARVVHLARRGDTVEVTVEVRGARATARAALSWEPGD